MSTDEYNEMIARDGRSLTSSEIDDILSMIPGVPSSCKAVKDFMREESKKRLRSLLEEVTITDAILPKFKKTIINKYYESLASPGEAVGNIAAGSVAAPATQMNLSAYHSTGLGGGVDPLKAILDLFGKKKDRDPERLVIHFVDYNMTESEVQEAMFKMEGININALLDPIEDMEIMKNYNTLNEVIEVAPWIPVWASINEKDLSFVNGDLFFRLKFNILQLYTYQILLDEIKTFLEVIEGVKCIPSHTKIGYLDIFVDSAFVSKLYSKHLPDNMLNKYDLINSYYKKAIKPRFEDTLSKRRIDNLKNSYVVESSVMQKFNGREKNLGGTKWQIWGDATEIRVEGIRDAKLRRLFEVCGIEVESGTYQSGLVTYVLNSPDGPPLSVISTKTGKANDNFNEYRKQTFEDGKYDLSMNFEGGEILRASRYAYAIANTDKLKKILSNPLVDPNITILRNPYKVYLIYGIEAARNMIIREVWETITGSGNSIAPRHISVIVDLMCWIGSIIATSSRGASKLGRETLADATFEKPLDFIQKASLIGAKETVKSTSTCVFLGIKCGLGTGASEVEEDPNIQTEMFNVGDGDDHYTPEIGVNLNVDDEFTLDNIDFTFDNEVRRTSLRQSIVNDEPIENPSARGSSALNIEDFGGAFDDGIFGGDLDEEGIEYDEDFDVLENLLDD